MNTIAVLGRKYSSEILAAAGQPVTVGRLCDDLDIPVATCYRRVNELSAAGLLAEQSGEQGGSEVTQFQRTTDGIDIRFDGSVSVHTWPRASRRPAVLDFLMSPFERLDMTARLLSVSQRASTEVAAPAISTPQEMSEEDTNSSKSSSS